MSTSIIQIKKSALAKNVKFVKELVGNKVKISAVIKGNAYGHGIEIAVPALEQLGINHFSVFSSEEAKRAFKSSIKKSNIMIMGYIEPGDFSWVIKNGIEFNVFDLEILKTSLKYSKRLNKKAVIHLEIETGMNRTGLTKNQLCEAVKILNENKKYFFIKGTSTHFAGAESIANHVRITQQYKVFQQRLKYLEKNNIKPKIKHVASSAGALNYPNYRLDMVRTGIMIFGYWPTKEAYIKYLSNHKLYVDPLERAVVWKSKIMSVKKVHQGEFVGYGFGFQAAEEMNVAIVPVGYTNGYSRTLSNNSHVLLHGKRAEVIGTVNMNMILINISLIDNVKIGDEVILIGKQGDHEISVSSFAEMNNGLNYELLTRLSEKIERKLID
jgi:alanine racemase